MFQVQSHKTKITTKLILYRETYIEIHVYFIAIFDISIAIPAGSVSSQDKHPWALIFTAIYIISPNQYIARVTGCISLILLCFWLANFYDIWSETLYDHIVMFYSILYYSALAFWECCKRRKRVRNCDFFLTTLYTFSAYGHKQAILSF